MEEHMMNGLVLMFLGIAIVGLTFWLYWVTFPPIPNTTKKDEWKTAWVNDDDF